MPKRNKKDADAAFLDAWRRMEQALKDEGPVMVAQLESNLKSQSRPDDASRLCMCRQVRNFMVHDGPGFVHASEEMTAFVEAMTYEIERVHGTVKDRMVTAARYGALDVEAPICNAGAMILAKKHGDILVLDKDKVLLGIMGPRAMAMALSDGAAADAIRYLADRGALDAPACAVPYDMPMTKAPGPGTKAVVTDAKGRCAGVLNPEGAWA